MPNNPARSDEVRQQAQQFAEQRASG